MDNKHIDGLTHEIKGTVKEHVGQATGNRSQQVEGNLEKNAGKAELTTFTFLRLDDHRPPSSYFKHTTLEAT